MPINSVISRGIALGVTTEIQVPVTAGVETVIIKSKTGNAAAGITLGATGVAAPGGDAFHLLPGESVAIDMANAQKLFVRGAALDVVYVLAGMMS